MYARPEVNGTPSTLGGRHAAVPLDALRNRPILLTSALDRPIVITRTAAYDRRVGERTLTLQPADAGRMRDRETGSSWSLEKAIWVKFHPESEIVKP